MSALLQSYFQKSTLPLHQISKLSSIQDGNLKLYETGAIKRPRRSTLLKICIALEINLIDTNKILKDFKKDGLDSDEDYSTIIGIIKSRKIPPGLRRLKPDLLQFEIEIMSIENLLGDIHLFTGYPHGVFSQYNLKEDYSEAPEVNHIYEKWSEQLLEYRKKIFRKAVKKNNINHLICTACLKDYIKESKDKNYIKETFKEMFWAVKNNTNYKLALVNECSHFYFHIQTPNKNEKPIVIFAGKSGNHVQNNGLEPRSQPLFGFVGRQNDLYKDFLDEFKELEKFKVTKSKIDVIQEMKTMLNDKGIDID